MKKYFIYILLLLIPILVHAEVKITNVEVVDHTESLEVAKPTYKDLKLDLNIKFNNVEDFVKYKLTVKNDNDKAYELSTSEEFSKGDYIKYDYSYDDNNIVEKNSEATIYITVTYVKEVPDDLLIEGKYIEKNNMTVDLSNEEKNPNTSVGVYILILIILSVISISLILLIRNKMNTIPVALLLFVLLPATIYAIEKLTIEVSTNIEISGKPITIFVEYCDNNNVYFNDSITIPKGITWQQIINNEEYNEFLTDSMIETILNTNHVKYHHEGDHGTEMSEFSLTTPILESTINGDHFNLGMSASCK